MPAAYFIDISAQKVLIIIYLFENLVGVCH